MLILCLSFSITILDQFTKYLVWHNFSVGSSVSVVPGLFNLTYVRNTGAAWGMLSGFNHMLVLLSFVMLAILVIFRRHFISERRVHHIAMGLMIAGIVGNLIDRVRLGYVIDFLDFYWKAGTSHFPAFNVADSAICIGVGLYVIFQVVPLHVQSKSADGEHKDDAK